MEFQLLKALLDELRQARQHRADLGPVLQASAAAIAADDAYRAELQGEVRALLAETTSTHSLTEAGILSDETIGAGVFRRLGARLAPAPPLSASLEHALSRLIARRDAALFASVRLEDATDWTCALLSDADDWDDPAELSSALVILATRIAGAGFDARLSERVPSLEAWHSPFIALSRAVDDFAEGLVEGQGDSATAAATLRVLERCTEQVVAFRTAKQTLGTTLHLSSTSLRVLQQLERLRLLIECTLDKRRPRALASLGLTLARTVSRPPAAIDFARQKLELIAYLVVGYAARKGAKYAVQTASEYAGFWARSLLGGCLVAIFASLKIHLSHGGLAPVPQALLYGVNYAVCFVLIYLFGATLATKQPAFTASMLAESLEGAPDSRSFAEGVRAIWRSQFVSFLGNIAGAAAFAVLLAHGFAVLTGHPLVSRAEAVALYDKMHPLGSGTIAYAAIAGVMLSLAGFFAGFVDNAVVFHRVGDRVRAGSGLFRHLGVSRRDRLAKRLDKSSGELAGNVLLGFMLGSAGALGVIFGLPFDIRHVAFASSHGALAVLAAPELMTTGHVLTVCVAVSVIGFVNFFVSFSLTLWVAIDARSLEGVDWRAQLRSVWQLVKANPIGFVLPLDRSARNT